jgi:hypothetical protein
VYTHQKIPTIEEWGNLNHIQNIVEKTKEVSQKPKKIGQIVSQTPALGPKHDKIWAQWASNILSKSMLKRV